MKGVTVKKEELGKEKHKEIKKKLIDKNMKFGELADKLGYSPWGLRNAINNLQPKVLENIEKILA